MGGFESPYFQEQFQKFSLCIFKIGSVIPLFCTYLIIDLFFVVVV